MHPDSPPSPSPSLEDALVGEECDRTIRLNVCQILEHLTAYVLYRENPKGVKKQQYDDAVAFFFPAVLDGSDFEFTCQILDRTPVDLQEKLRHLNLDESILSLLRRRR